MSQPTANPLTLRIKFIIGIGLIVSLSYALLLYKTSLLQNQLIILQGQQQARMLYDQILLTRQWVADHNGIFILKEGGVTNNPFLPLPEIQDTSGRTYVMRNPAMVTRELSEYSDTQGHGRFRVTSLNPINPGNAPDPFEEQSMLGFEQGAPESMTIHDSPTGRTIRYIAPLTVTASCLVCHATHGYQEGDLRGALSITIPIDWADKLIAKNKKSLVFIGLITIFLVTAVLFLMLDTVIIKRINKLATAMNAFPEQDPQDLPSGQDEIADLSNHFEQLCQRLNQSQIYLEQVQKQGFFNEKMASLGILSAGIAHEVNNPLGGMLNCVKAMRDNPGNPDLEQRYLPLIEKGLRQIEQTMRQLLNFGRTEPLQRRQLDLEALIRECFQLLSYKLRDIDLQLDLTLDRTLILDAEAMKQIIINIGLNAIQAMDGHGILKVSGKCDEEQLFLSFSDSGPGIGEQHLPHIFDPFFTTKDVGEGTGLGLAVTYSLVQRMKGTITAESVVGQGSLFTICLPLTSQGHEQPAVPARRTENTGSPPARG